MADIQSIPTDGPSSPIPTGQTTDQTPDQKVVEDWLENKLYTEYATIEPKAYSRKLYALRMGQFLDILRTAGPKSWLYEDAINMSLALLTNIPSRRDCFFLPSFDAQMLCQLGLGVVGIDGLYPEIGQSLRDADKRWIIIPCNDGMLGNLFDIPVGEDGKIWEMGKQRPAKEDPQHLGKQRPTKEDPKKQNAVRRPLGEGEHWGLMIIDKREETARWLDSAVSLKEQIKNGKKVTSISEMFNAGRAAGKVLRGYDKLLGRKPGQFTVSTIKWSAHQTYDNTTVGDRGACGPWMYACLKHIYETPGALDDVNAHFKRGSRVSGVFGRGGKGFNSKRTREDIVKQIRLKQEEKEKREELGLGLKPEIIKILGLGVSLPDLFAAVKRHQSVQEEEVEDEGLALKLQQAHDKLQEYQPQWQAALAEGVFDGDLSGYVKMLKVQEQILGDAEHNGDSEETPITYTRVSIGDVLYVVPNDDEQFWETQDESWSDDDIPDFARMPKKELREWEALHPKIAKAKGKRGEGHTHATSRAMLQAKFKETFLREPDANFRDVWVRDHTVFDKHITYTVPQIRYEIMNKYEPKTLERLEKYAQSATSTGSGTVINHATTTPPPRTHQSAIIHPHDIDMVPRDFADEQEVDEPALAKWKEANEHHFEEMKLREEGTGDHISFRAALQALSGSSFTDESDARLRTIWIRDGFALDEGFRAQDVADLDFAAMRIRLWDVYERFRLDGSEGLPDSDSDSDGDGDDSNDDVDVDSPEEDSPDANPKKGEGSKKRPYEPEEGEEEDGHTTKKQKHGDESEQSHTNGPKTKEKKRVVAYPKGFTKNTLPELASLQSKQLPILMTVNKDLFDGHSTS
ncbi:hypothetical protein P153DRAFT_360728 [Dothidotthia symphoricarpi CBS 119687]|uniref:Ubiquitin-like protease family profile domain-containing protein n=1 Tax=Dothidotthia symphoricarpi CBS 119687 TaxID=1392245 RepID=A0A6A6A1R9_9PLEO|nr:uncharacterized protein P153DRAFT_360728 [Dothidotthia symphoricarpi CBS 119687]KAF2125123.1 hypothetical protein P153DRAFT_360728 [Dothidotthia symphoricarpi CBS 119687]